MSGCSDSEVHRHRHEELLLWTTGLRLRAKRVVECLSDRAKAAFVPIPQVPDDGLDRSNTSPKRAEPGDVAAGHSNLELQVKVPDRSVCLSVSVRSSCQWRRWSARDSPVDLAWKVRAGIGFVAAIG